MGMDELAQEEHAEEVEGPIWSPEDHHPKGNAMEKKPVKEIKKDWRHKWKTGVLSYRLLSRRLWQEGGSSQLCRRDLAE